MPEEKKPRRATALRYEGEGAPKVVATGRGEIAKKIIERAKGAGVPIREEAPLAGALSKLELHL